jgi:hypothetical protein
LLLAVPKSASADVYARVLTNTAPIRTGPGASYRQVRTVVHDDVLAVTGRGTRGYWLEVTLDDGTSGWILGEEVDTFEVGDDNPGFWERLWRGFRHAVLGPSTVPDAHGEVSFSAGVIGGEGLFLVRPAWLIDPYFALEGFIGASPSADENLLLAGGGWTLRMIPGAAIDPYLHAGAGIVRREPKADVYTMPSRSEVAAEVGGGIEIALRIRLTLRIDFRQWIFFDENSAQDAREVTGGLAVFF